MKSFFAFLLGGILLFLTACGASGAEAESTPAPEGASDAVTVNTVAADRVSMRYMRFGKGEKTMVILPGLSPFHVTDSADAVAAGFASFTEEYTVYLFDVRDDVPEGYTMQQMAEDTVSVFTALGLRDIDLYGVSMGGMVSVYIAGEYPELVDSLVLASTSCRSSATACEVLGEWVRLADAGDRMGLAVHGAEHVYSAATCDAYGDALYAGYDTLTGDALVRFSRSASAILDFDFTAQAEKITCPVLVLGSEGDEALGTEAVRELAERTGAELYLYDACYGHAVYDEAPDFRDRILAFFSR